MLHVLTDIGNTCIWASAAMIVIWVVQYSLLASWWRHFTGITMVGLAVCILAIYIPSLMALADPAAYANFATTTWYQWLAICIVVATALFLATRIVTWEMIRRKRGTGSAVLPSEMAARMKALEAENAELREHLAKNGG